MNQLQTPPNSTYESPQQSPHYHANPTNEIPTVGNFVVVQLLAMIPLIGFILMIIWAIGGSGTPLWRSNYARAFFVMMAIGIVISILMSIFLGVILASLFASVAAIFSELM
ncbi:MAG: hypothetical protein FWD19_05515 [Defluviitaleaceae bacterium]|nr:hypothetical protein [Defluviitaleaceae bacterium]